MRTIYFDYNATTPLDPAVRGAMMPFLDEIFGNPSSVHHVGRRARAVLDEARDRTAKVFACKPSEIVFTSGGTESVNLAIFGVARLLRDKGRHIITSAVEHHAVLHSCQHLARREGFDLTVLPVDAEGRVRVNDLAGALRSDTILVSIQAANNETGTLQPVAELGALCRKRGIFFHTDAVQCFGKEPFANIHQFNADLVSICAHKFHGPKGSGALFVRSPLHPDPIFFGGAHENERRAGTENVAGIFGFVEALERFVTRPVFPRDRLLELSSHLLDGITCVPGVHFRGVRGGRLANTISVTVEGSDSIALLAGLDLEGICASSGSACSAGSLEPSHVMTAMGVSPDEANSLLRFSLGRESSLDDVTRLLDVFPSVVDRIRHASLRTTHPTTRQQPVNNPSTV